MQSCAPLWTLHLGGLLTRLLAVLRQVGFVPLRKDVQQLVHREQSSHARRLSFGGGKAAGSGSMTALEKIRAETAMELEQEAASAASGGPAPASNFKVQKDVLLTYRYQDGFSAAVRRPVYMSDLF